VPLGLRWEYPLWTAALDVDTTKLKGRLTGNQRRQQDQDREGLDVVLGKLREGPATITELVRRGIGMGKPRAEKLLGLLIDAGDVTRESGTVWGNQATIYQLTEGDE
ncbi:MAG TPA: hypothetical protein PKC18_16085, partial [Lacipirellulaceae bacterium]|nr:hypothetical protein [Lacipirellulaceae bacterium]